MLLEFKQMTKEEMYRMVHEIYIEASYEIAKEKYPELEDLTEAIREEEYYFVEKFLGKFLSKHENTYYVLEEEGQWVCALRLTKLDGFYYMEALETAPEQRQKGYASKLIKEVIKFVKQNGETSIRSNVNKTNDASLATHKKCGFEIVEENGINYISGEQRNNVYGMLYSEQRKDGEKEMKSNPIMHIEMEMGGIIDIELYPEITYNSVRSVIWLAKQGLYDGRVFYRVVKDFVIQTDCDKRPGIFEEGCDYIIDGEYANSGYMAEQPSFEKYIVGMAGCGGNSNISAGSQFFIMTGERKSLDGNFAVIGKVINGFEVVDKVNEAECHERVYRDTIKFFTPKEPQRMKRVWVDTFGEEYEAPKTKIPSEEFLAEERELDALVEFHVR